jgi:hypothetical protein
MVLFLELNNVMSVCFSSSLFSEESQKIRRNSTTEYSQIDWIRDPADLKPRSRTGGRLAVWLNQIVMQHEVDEMKRFLTHNIGCQNPIFTLGNVMDCLAGIHYLFYVEPADVRAYSLFKLDTRWSKEFKWASEIFDEEQESKPLHLWQAALHCF